MEFDWRLFVTALGLAFVLEGLPYFLFAERLPKVLLLAAARGPAFLRAVGAAAIALGLGLVFLMRG